MLRLQALLAMMLSVAPLVASADVGMDAARRAAEGAVGHSLEAATGTVEHLGSRSVAAFRESRGDTYRVDLSDGAFLGWVRSAAAPAEAPAPLMELPETEELARATARQVIGAAVDAARWTAMSTDGPRAEYVAQGPAAGDPPRLGLTLSLHLVVDRRSREVIALTVDRPKQTDPLPVSVDGTGAVSAARKEVGDSSAVLVGDPVLEQRDGQVRWLVKLAPEGKPHTVVTVDAQSGGVLSKQEALTALSPQHVGASAAARASPLTSPAPPTETGRVPRILGPHGLLLAGALVLAVTVGTVMLWRHAGARTRPGRAQ